MSSEGNFLGDSQLGHSKLGPTTQRPGELDTGVGPRDRFEEWMKSVYPTEEGTTWDAFLNTLADEFETELAARQNIYFQQYIDTATRAQLDKIGALFDLDRRQGESDAFYRRRIKLQLRKYTAGATIDELLNLSADLLDCTTSDIELVESFGTEPARFDVFVNEQVVTSSPISVDQYVELLQEVKAGGVRVNATIGAQFTHRSEYEYENNINDPDRGYGSLDGSVEGAPYADMITARHRVPSDNPELTPDLSGFGEGGFGSAEFGL